MQLGRKHTILIQWNDELQQAFPDAGMHSFHETVLPRAVVSGDFVFDAKSILERFLRLESLIPVTL
jgi:hypothetical protein